MPASRTHPASGIALTAMFLAHFGLAAPATAFEPGGVFWAPGSCGSPCGVFEITGGGSFNAGALIGAASSSPGQIAWSADLQTLYLTEYGTARVLRISNAGAVDPFATGISGPTGLALLADGRLLVVSYGDEVVIDISAGGDFTGAPSFASGFAAPRNLLQLENGSLLLADQSLNRVFDISGGGDFTGAEAFAYGFSSGPYDLVQDESGRIFASTKGPIFEITSGVDVSQTTSFASGIRFMGLTIDGDGRLLASELNTGRVFDVSEGGDHFASADPFAEGLPGYGDTALDALPGGELPPPPVVVPALGPFGTALLIGVLAAGGLFATRSQGLRGRSSEDTRLHQAHR